ncbi:hypothetical protein NDA16_001753 [Ustilago loliicola]|nr:hypothetical protein NDA16_001753 [Ustilago loliicola]
MLPNAIFELLALGIFVHTLLKRRRYIQLATERPVCVQHRDGGIVLLALFHLVLVLVLLGLAAHRLPGIASSTGLATLVLPSLALEALSALIIVCVVALHRPTVSTPIATLINTFLLFSSLSAAVQLRTFYMIPAARLSAFLPVFAADFGTRWLLFLTTSTKPYEPRSTAEERASFVSKVFFLYLLPFLWKGTKKPIELDDIEPLASSYASRTLEARIYREWHASAGTRRHSTADADALQLDLAFPADIKASHDAEALALSDLDSVRTCQANGLGNGPKPLSFLPKDRNAQPKLVHASLRAFAGVLFTPLPSKALITILTLLQPLLVQETLDFIVSYSDPSEQPKPASHGYGIVGAFLLVFLLFALARGHFMLSIYKTTCKLRGALVQVVYDKTLVLSVDALQDSETPSPTVMQSVDIERIVGGLDPFHELWSAVVVIAVALYLMYAQVGIAFIATIATLAALFATIPLMTKDAKAHQEQWSKLTDERTSLISAAINAIKAVKQSALEGFLIDKVVTIRRREVHALIKYVRDLVFISVLGTVAGDILLMATITTFALVAAFHQTPGAFPFTTSAVFTTITIVRIIERPLFIVGRRYASVVSAVTSLKRLQTFLLLPEQVAGEQNAAWSPPSEKVPLATSTAAVFEGVSMAWKQGVPRSSHDAASTAKQTTGADVNESTCSAEKIASKDQGVPVLQDLNLVVPLNKITVVVGEVGTGKTSLLCSLLGELTMLTGEVMLPVRAAPIAYVSQEPWTQGKRSIKENVVFYRLFDEDRYQRALSACGLAVDVQQLPKGDGTLAKHLSGGQKQRVALCRAVYADAPTYVLDDVLSAVDASTAAGINRALFSRQTGFLRGKTVVMATNSVQQMQLADQIVQMSTGGAAKMLAGEADTVSKLAENIDTIRRKSIEEESEEGSGGGTSAAAEIRAAAAKERKTLEMEEEQEEVSTGRVKLSTLKRYFAAAGWWSSLLYPLILAVQTGFAQAQLLWLQAWAKKVTEATLRGSIGLRIGILALLVFGRFAMYAGSLVIYLYYFSSRASIKLHRDEVLGLLQSGADHFLNMNPGRMINRFTQDIYALDYQICAYIVNVYFFVIEVGFSLVLMVVPAPYLLGVVAAMAILYYGIYKLYSPSSRQLRRLEMATKSPLHSQFKDTADLQGHGGSARPVDDSSTADAIVLLERHVLIIGHVTATVLFFVDSDLNGLMESWTELEIGLVALERIEQVITIAKDPKDDSSKLLEMPSAAPDARRLKSAVPAVSVRFEDVTVGYGGKEGPMSLSKVSFSLRPGERLGVCGRSGSGKSTMLLSLLRILEPASGRIFIDGIDTATLTGTSVRKNISYIPQEPMMLLSLSVRENLDPEGEYTDDEAYWKVLRQTSMYNTISQLSDGLDEIIDLQSLSMGQKQLLNVARALLKIRGLLVMDEATSNLDGETDAQIQLALAAAVSGEMQEGRGQPSRTDSKKPLMAFHADDEGFVAVAGRPTTITIAHRLSTIMDYDKILVLGNGEVLEFGSPSQLLQLKNGHFASMVEEQNREVD